MDHHNSKRRVYWINREKGIAFPCTLSANDYRDDTTFVYADIEIPSMKEEAYESPDIQTIEAKATDICLSRPQNIPVFNAGYYSGLYRGYVRFLNLVDFDLKHGNSEEVTYFEYFTDSKDRSSGM